MCDLFLRASIKKLLKKEKILQKIYIYIFKSYSLKSQQTKKIKNKNKKRGKNSYLNRKIEKKKEKKQLLESKNLIS